jgi:hypothetical protein
MAELRGVVVDDMVMGSLKRPTDQLGRQQPRILGAFGILSIGIGCGMPAPIQVPGEFWSLDVGENRCSVAVIACPCGSEARCEVGCTHRCGCERLYFFPIDTVVVFNSPKGREIDATPAEPGEVGEPPTPELQSEL